MIEFGRDLLALVDGIAIGLGGLAFLFLVVALLRLVYEGLAELLIAAWTWFGLFRD